MVMKWPPVYTATFGTYVKIGLSRKPGNRRDRLQTGNPFELIVKEKYYVRSMKLAEDDAHDVVQEYQTFGGGTERFHVPKGVNLNNFIDKVFNKLLDKKHLS